MVDASVSPSDGEPDPAFGFFNVTTRSCEESDLKLRRGAREEMDLESFDPPMEEWCRDIIGEVEEVGKGSTKPFSDQR